MTHLKIEQNTSSIEVVDAKVITKLYDLTSGTAGTNLDSTSNLKGNLQCSHAYEDVVSYLTTKYPNLLISVTGGLYIRFNDKTVESICATNWGDRVGITPIQASVVNSFLNKFNGNTTITDFSEFKKFLAYTTVDNWAFSGCSHLKTIDLSNISTLGVQSFLNCTSLKSINLTSKCTAANNWYGTFRGCSNLTDVGDISGFPTVWDSTFKDCIKLATTNVSTNCKSIGDDAYCNDALLTSIGITSAVTSIGNGAFLNCTSLATFDSSAVTSIGDNAFNGCTLLSTLDLTLTISIGSYGLSKMPFTTINLPKCTTLGDNALYYCLNLTSVSLNTSLTILQHECLEDCAKLTTVTGCSAVTTVGYSAFKRDYLLQSVDLTSTCTSIGSEAFSDCNALTNINTSNISVFPYSIFSNCQVLTSLDTHLATSVEDSAFYGCASIPTFSFPNTLSSVADNAFGHCSALTSIDFATGGTTLLSFGARLFDSCTLLNYIILPANTYSIALDFLGYHDNASTIVLNSSTPPKLGGPIGGSSSTLFYVPDNSVSTYKAATNWSHIASRIYGMSTYHIGTEIAASTFLNWTGLKSIDLTNVTLINHHAFANSGLTNNYTLGDMLICSSTSESNVKEWAFDGCKNITSVTLPHVLVIGTGAFTDCTGLQRVKLGSYIMGINNLCFLNCTALDFVHIDNTTCPTVSTNAFDGAKSTFKIYVPDDYVSTYKAASGWSTFADRIYSFTQLDTDFPGTR